jgi:hypothetical protein
MPPMQAAEEADKRGWEEGDHGHGGSMERKEEAAVAKTSDPSRDIIVYLEKLSQLTI